MPVLQATLYIVFAGYALIIAAVVFGIAGGSVTPEAHPHGPECAGCMLSFAVFPLAWMLYRLKRLRSVKPAAAGASALTAAAACGALGVRLVESETLSEGMILWHALPFMLLALSGIIVGKKIFRW